MAIRLTAQECEQPLRNRLEIGQRRHLTLPYRLPQLAFDQSNPDSDRVRDLITENRLHPDEFG
jgi:hypothetical protein